MYLLYLYIWNTTWIFIDERTPLIKSLSKYIISVCNLADAHIYLYCTQTTQPPEAKKIYIVCEMLSNVYVCVRVSPKILMTMAHFSWRWALFKAHDHLTLRLYVCAVSALFSRVTLMDDKKDNSLNTYTAKNMTRFMLIKYAVLA